MEELNEAIVQTRTRVAPSTRVFNQGAKSRREAVAKTEKLLQAARGEQQLAMGSSSRLDSSPSSPRQWPSKSVS